jgi:hypothetical protein
MYNSVLTGLIKPITFNQEYLPWFESCERIEFHKVRRGIDMKRYTIHLTASEYNDVDKFMNIKKGEINHIPTKIVTGEGIVELSEGEMTENVDLVYSGQIQKQYNRMCKLNRFLRDICNENSSENNKLICLIVTNPHIKKSKVMGFYRGVKYEDFTLPYITERPKHPYRFYFKRV